MLFKNCIFICFLITSCSSLTLRKSAELNYVSELDVYCDEAIKEPTDSIFIIASYNVENLFDDVEDGYEYKDYSQKTSNYSKEFFLKKIDNIKKVLNDLDSDIVGLQEIESKRAIAQLFENVKEIGFKCYAIADKPQFTIVKTAIISKYEILSAYGYRTIPNVRNILLAKILVNNETLIVFVNHWKSKRYPESERIKIAQIKRKIIDSIIKLNPNAYIISLGDFNTHYNDNESDVIVGDAFNYKPVIGLRDILLKDSILYNLWVEIPENQVGSYYFRSNWGTLDHILVSKSIFKGNGKIKYMRNSFNVFKVNYLLTEDGIPYRWQIEFEGDRTIHLGKGFSDHLPIYAKFKVVP